MASSHQAEHHNSPTSVDLHRGEHGGRLPQQTQTAEVGLQTSPIRVSEDLPQTSGPAHSGCLCVQRIPPDSQVHDLGGGSQGCGNQHPGLLLGSSDLAIPPGPSPSSGSGEGSGTADRGDSNLPGVEGGNVVASVGRTEDGNGPSPVAGSSGLPQVTQGEHRGTPQFGSTVRFPHQREDSLVSRGEDPESLSDADHAFLRKHLRKGTTTTYGSGWRLFQRFCQGFRINPQLAPLPLIVKFIRNLYEREKSAAVVGTAMSAISKYHIIDASTGLSIGKHPLVTTAKKAFWQLRPPIPRYRGTYDVTIVLRYIESLGQNADLTLKQLSEKAAFLVAFATLSRYCGP